MLVAGSLAGRVGQRALLMVVGTIFGLAFLLLYLTAGAAPRYLIQWLPGMVLTGIGVGLVLPSRLGELSERRRENVRQISVCRRFAQVVSCRSLRQTEVCRTPQPQFRNNFPSRVLSLSGRWWERRSLLIAVLIAPLATARGTNSVAVLYAYHLGRIETRFG